MAIDMTQALSQYGWVAQLCQAIPDLQSVLVSAEQSQLTPDEFQRQLEASPWWQQHADSVRQLAIQQATDPATYQQNLQNATTKVYLAAEQEGRSVDSGSLALQLLTNNWDDQELKAVIGVQGKLTSGPDESYIGDAAQLSAHLTQTAANYGVPAGSDWMNNAITRIQSGADTIDGVTLQLQQRAQMQYPQFQAQIAQGQTMKDIADPWVQTMAKTLEVPDASIDFAKDPYIQKALTQRNADGSATVMPLYQFQRQLKDDPRYDKTTQARTDAYTVLAQVGKDFGFAT